MKPRNFFASFFMTLLIIAVATAAVIIVYRIESALNVDPIVIFSLSEHLEGEYVFTLFGLKGSFNTNDWSSFFHNKVKYVPAQAKAFCELLNHCADLSASGINYLLN